MSESGLETRVRKIAKLAIELAPLPQEVSRLADRMDAVESEIVRLRADMNDGFSAIRDEMSEHARETAGHILGTQRQIAETQRQVGEMRHQVGEVQRQMLVLHEDVVERISRIGRG